MGTQGLIYEINESPGCPSVFSHEVSSMGWLACPHCLVARFLRVKVETGKSSYQFLKV